MECRICAADFYPMKTALLGLILVGFTAIFFVINKDEDPLSSIGKTAAAYHGIAQAIKANYDQQLDRLTGYKASHYAARIYRISGDSAYLNYNLRDLELMTGRVEKLLQVAQEDAAIEYSHATAQRWSSSPRAKLRRESLAIAPDFPYYLNSLGILRRAAEYRVCAPQFEQLKAHVLSHDYMHYFSNPLMIQAWAAQLANVAVWVKLLGGDDYSDEFTHAMQQVYPHGQDHLLNAQQYQNKLYGLTHIILANSEYYQRTIKRSDFAWIFDYFDDHIDTIVARASVDVIAEVGIAYLLAEEFDHPALEKTKRSIAQQYDATYQMIPSHTGEFNIASGSHRNILSIMLLSSPRKLYPGPWLSGVAAAMLC